MQSFQAVVFPGQGAQKKGMAEDFVEHFSVAAEVFNRANELLSFDVKELCFSEDERLHQTQYTQPAILCAEVAMYKSICQAHDFAPRWFAGHSLGEYAALCASGALSFEVALKMVEKRGELMGGVVCDGGMSAVIMDNLDSEALEHLCNEFNVEVANDNSLTQVVLSGELCALEALTPILEEAYSEKGVRVVPLKVSAPFHSRFMKGIEKEYHQFISQFKDDIDASKLSHVVSNVTGDFYPQDKEAAISLLSSQLSGGVKWRANMQALLSKTHDILELGPNRPLRGFFSTLDVNIQSVINLKSARKVFAE